MKWPFARRTAHAPLWQWVGLRMSALAVVTVLVIAFGMWLRFAIWDIATLHKLPPAARQEMMALRQDPHSNAQRLWQLFERYYDVADFLPGLANRDWLLLAVLLIASIPVIVVCGLLASRPLSRQFSNVAAAARRISDGDFSARAKVIPRAPDELASFAMDFNGMTAQLQQYEREVRDSSAMLAHELRTPLNAAMGRVQGMLDQVFPCSDEQLQMVHRQLEQINRLVGDLHLLSMARANQLMLEPHTFPIDALIRERLAWLAQPLQAAQMEVAVEVRVPGGVSISADRDRIGQVLSVLIDNALRYGAAGKRLSIEVGTESNDVLICVCDRGPGVAPELLPRMVDRFWRAEDSRARHSGGSGLGLSIAAAICHAHGGALEFSNREGGGLCARVRLPRAP
ncbi:HAMP domain-containing histidine kinase [Xanthomonas hyacinthi]|uniref:histidine kinase n=1 Tax=Xanthomonas hyacinthi TaxID=56455 RepID=A0A2S7F1T2_9XANT|nr:ATP-binding protein [Xanthomonas hyacinthi]KLD73702.1 two-component system sensor protein [Xanthomonas hyacinthi DSM 19077]PPU99389.1 sensor histidine kinase [Xanthomonas hyacinthi]QGY78384.1 HAMP domain-containing histidine kinase [Xanthomonas hyacinthi]